MSLDIALVDQLGSLFRYPDESYQDRLESCQRGFSKSLPKVGQALARVQEALRGQDLWQLEELFTRTFDLNPVCALEIGWHLYGEQYERGRFLAHGREMLEQLGIDEKNELPDHLSSMIAALGRLEDEDAAPFAARYLLPALMKMSETLENNESPFAGLMKAATELAHEKSGGLPVQPPKGKSDVVQIGGSQPNQPKWRSIP